MTTFEALTEIARSAHAVATMKPTYPTLLIWAALHGRVCGVPQIEVTHATASGCRCVVHFSPLDAGELHETNNATQRYEILVNPLPEEK